MKIVNMLLLIIIALLSIAAGVAKLMQVPQELEFLQSAGLNATLIMVFGVAQVTGGLLLLIPKTRVFAAVLVFLGFALSSLLIFIVGDIDFALISLIPVALTVYLFYQAIASKASTLSKMTFRDEE